MIEIEEEQIYWDNIDNDYMKLNNIEGEEVQFTYARTLEGLEKNGGKELSLDVDEFKDDVSNGSYTLIIFNPKNWDEVLKQ